MHATLAGDGYQEAWLEREAPPARSATRRDVAAPVTAGESGGRYGEGRRLGGRPIAIVMVGLIHAGLLAAFLTLNIVPLKRVAVAPLVVDLMIEAPPPPPAAPPEPQPVPQKTTVPVIVSPPPIVQTTLVTPPPVATVREAPPPQAVIVAPPSPAPVAGPVAVDDLSSSVLSMSKPRIPAESRRKREGGTVLVLVTVGLDGRVEQASLSRGSGYPGIDSAVIEAVRRWRWSPTTRGGQAVRVRGIVTITITPPPA